LSLGFVNVPLAKRQPDFWNPVCNHPADAHLLGFYGERMLRNRTKHILHC